MVVLNKIDLANSAVTDQYIEYIKETEKVPVIGLSASKYYEIEKLLEFV